jgi:hypothetical protein
MLEIIALIFLTKNIGILAAKKGLKPGTWKLYTVLSWFGAEILGVILGFTVFGEEGIFPAVLIGLAFAIGSFYLLRFNLSKRPDVDDDIEHIGIDVKN